MYECPEECGSTTFVQTIKQVETVHLNDAGDPVQFEKNGGSELLALSCGECGADLNVEETTHESKEERHVASIVFTHALPPDTDLVVETLEQSDFLRVDRVNAHYADIVVEEVDA